MRLSSLILLTSLPLLIGCTDAGFKPHDYEKDEGAKINLKLFNQPVSVHGKTLHIKKELNKPKKRLPQLDLPPAPPYDDERPEEKPNNESLKWFVPTKNMMV